MRKSILFVLMMVVLFVVSVMPVAANHAPGDGMSMPQCRNHDTLRMFWYTNNTDLTSWGTYPLVAVLRGSKVRVEGRGRDRSRVQLRCAHRPLERGQGVYLWRWTQSGKYWDFDDTHLLQLEQKGVYPYNKYKYRLNGINADGGKITGITFNTTWQPSYGCHK